MSSQPIDRHTPLTEEPLRPVRLAMPYFQGDFARGQRTRAVPVAVVGSFANQRAANSSAEH